MSNEPKQAENGDRLLCDPWRGARTPEFRKFKRDFKASADAMFLHEDDYSIWQAMADTDQGGRDQAADALPGANQAGHTNAVRRGGARWSCDVETSDGTLKRMIVPAELEHLITTER